MQGYDPVVLTTGSDEHSRNVEHAAQAAASIRRRRTHASIGGGVQRPVEASSASTTTISSAPPIPSITRRCAICFERCQKNGYIYKGSYTGAVLRQR